VNAGTATRAVVSYVVDVVRHSVRVDSPSLPPSDQENSVPPTSRSSASIGLWCCRGGRSTARAGYPAAGGWSGVWRLSMIENVPQELTESATYSIVFVHGLGSNPDTTWRAGPPRADPANPKAPDSGDEDVCWVTNFLPHDLPSPVRRKTRIFFYNHDSYWKREAVQTRLWNLAGNMLHHVREKIHRTYEVGS
jgi:hypothetical protein